MKKKIEGYLAPFDLYDGKIKEGSIYIKEGDSYVNNNNIRGCLYPLPSEIVEKYFIPKYKEEKIFVDGCEVVFHLNVYYPTSIKSTGYTKQFWKAAKEVCQKTEMCIPINLDAESVGWIDFEKINKILERLKE